MYLFLPLSHELRYLGVMTGHGISRREKRLPDSSSASRQALESVQLLTQRVLGSLSLGVKRPELEPDHSSLSDAV
jgi:hypothetical protein